MGLPVRRDEQGPPHLTMRPAALPPGMPFELVHVRTAGLDVYSTHLQPMPAQAAHRVQQVLFIDDAVGRSAPVGLDATHTPSRRPARRFHALGDGIVPLSVMLSVAS